jgi:hypothetical protein
MKCAIKTCAMNKINTQISGFYNLGGGANFSSLPQVQKTLLLALAVCLE